MEAAEEINGIIPMAGNERHSNKKMNVVKRVLKPFEKRLSMKRSTKKWLFINRTYAQRLYDPRPVGLRRSFMTNLMLAQGGAKPTESEVVVLAE